jgi:hypothetical protein
MRPTILATLMTLVFSAQNCAYAQTFRTDTYLETVKTLTVFPNDDWAGTPILRMDSDDAIGIGFDELSHDYKRYAYRVIHCNADWKRSDMTVLEYMDGFPENDVPNGEQSVGTLTLYTHYALRIPNDEVKLRISGNYAVEIFDKDGNGEPILTACFSVLDNKSVIDAALTATTDIDFKQAHQQLQLSVRPVGLTINQPLRELQLVVQQNNRRDMEVRNLEPSSMNGNSLLFEHKKELIFKGNNEYRRFEMTSYKYPGLNVNRIEYFKPFYNVELLPSAVRNTGYTYDKDQNGKFLIHSQEAIDDKLGADYYLVHFSFPMEQPYLDGGIFLTGALVNDKLDSRSKLLYNFENKAYEKTLLLKQGAYNFQYVFRPTNNGKPTSERLEGSYWETENDYQVYLYYRAIGERYDRLIGFRQLKSAF